MAPPFHHRCAMVPLPVNGEDFGSSALRLAGFCGAVLGWSPDRFWGATPAEVVAVAAVLCPVEAQAVDGATLTRLREAFPDG